MKKNPITLVKRASFIQNQMNKRHKSESAQMCAERLARELFLSESTVWKDFTKQITK
jgi:biotin operon repressor